MYKVKTMIVRVVTKKARVDTEEVGGAQADEEEEEEAEEEPLDYEAVFEKVYRKRAYHEKRCKLLNVAKVVLLKTRYKPLLEFPPLSADDQGAKKEEEAAVGPGQAGDQAGEAGEAGDRAEREYAEMRKLVDAALADKTTGAAAGS